MNESIIKIVEQYMEEGFSADQAIQMYIASELTSISYNLFKIAQEISKENGFMNQ